MEETKKTDANQEEVKNLGTTSEENQDKIYTQADFDKALKEKLEEARKNGNIFFFDFVYFFNFFKVTSVKMLFMFHDDKISFFG